MKIAVRLYATLITSVPQDVLARHPELGQRGTHTEIELSEGSTLSDLVTYLNLPQEQVKVIFVNGKKKDLNYRLTAGDEVGIFPPIGGG
jgi:molybdopterin converting factor small subunit